MSKKTQIEVQDEQNNAGLETDLPDEKTTLPESQASPEAPAAAEDDLAQKLKTAEDEAKTHYDRLLRVSAEFDNFKKRTQREMDDLRKFANESMLRDLLGVVDNLERAVESATSDDSSVHPVVEGVHLTLNDIVKVLERYQVKPVTALGEVFDPNFHQAMMQEEVSDQPANMVIRELQKGYMIHDRLLRPALVVVSKTAPSGGDAD